MQRIVWTEPAHQGLPVMVLLFMLPRFILPQVSAGQSSRTVKMLTWYALTFATVSDTLKENNSNLEKKKDTDVSYKYSQCKSLINFKAALFTIKQLFSFKLGQLAYNLVPGVPVDAVVTYGGVVPYVPFQCNVSPWLSCKYWISKKIKILNDYKIKNYDLAEVDLVQPLSLHSNKTISLSLHHT